MAQNRVARAAQSSRHTKYLTIHASRLIFRTPWQRSFRSAPPPQPSPPHCTRARWTISRSSGVPWRALGTFTAVSGWGMVLVGVLAIGTAVIAAKQPTERWLSMWLAMGVFALVVQLWAMLAKAPRVEYFATYLVRGASLSSLSLRQSSLERC